MIYFVVKTPKNKITVIDLSEVVEYQRDEWNTVDSWNFSNAEDAIEHALLWSHVLDLPYEKFESRYGS